MTVIFRQQDIIDGTMCEIDCQDISLSVKCFKSLRQRSEVKAKVHRLSLWSYKNTSTSTDLNTIYVRYKTFITKKVYTKINK